MEKKFEKRNNDDVKLNVTLHILVWPVSPVSTWRQVRQALRKHPQTQEYMQSVQGAKKHVTKLNNPHFASKSSG